MVNVISMFMLSSIHLRVSEKINLVAGRDGGLQNMEVLGLIMLRIADPEYGRIKVLLGNKETRPIQFQVGVGVGVVYSHMHAE